MTTFKAHPDYSTMLPYVEMVRDCIAGEPIIKSKTTDYLKHPNMVDKTSAQQLARYDAYLDGAEFDGFPAETEHTMLGQMTAGEFVYGLPESLAYLETNADGDGMPLQSLIEFLYKNILEVKYHIMVAEYQGLADVDVQSVTLADMKQLNPRASIKLYNRESLIDWGFTRINGVMQLSLMVLKEVAQVRGENYNTKDVTSYLVLGLDDQGYFQQKFVVGAEGNVQQDGEKVYPLVGGSPLKWLPVEIVADEEIPAGKLPQGLGYLSPVCSKALYRYRASADYKEALRMMQPTLFSSGWKDSDKDLFDELNGRDYIAFGAGVSNQLPEGVSVDVVGLGVQTEPFTEYFTLNGESVRALGGSFDDGTGKMQNKSATQSSIESAKSTAVMAKIANNVQEAVERTIAYCAMFEGLTAPDGIDQFLDQIDIQVPRKFGETKLSPQEVAEIRNNVQSSLISKDEGLRQLVAGGWAIEDADTILAEIESQGPDVGVGVPPAPFGTVIAEPDSEE